jgi:hypothetical protein
MFYCDSCGHRENWPLTPRTMQSWGHCEVCNLITGCSDVPSRLLPDNSEQQAIDSIKQTIEKRST